MYRCAIRTHGQLIICTSLMLLKPGNLKVLGRPCWLLRSMLLHIRTSNALLAGCREATIDQDGKHIIGSNNVSYMTGHTRKSGSSSDCINAQACSRASMLRLRHLSCAACEA